MAALLGSFAKVKIISDWTPGKLEDRVNEFCEKLDAKDIVGISFTSTVTPLVTSYHACVTYVERK